MKRFVQIACLLAAAAAVGAEPGRELSIRGWLFEVPAYLTQKVHDGPDFTVTYLSSEEKKLGMGIYEGGFPQEASKGQRDVRREKEKVCGQDVSWAMWEDMAGDAKRFRFEVYLRIGSEKSQSDRFHFFGYAASAEDLDSLRAIVRTGHRKEPANQSPQPTSSAVTPAAEQPARQPLGAAGH